jgi:hypothetical protein
VLHRKLAGVNKKRPMRKKKHTRTHKRKKVKPPTFRGVPLGVVIRASEQSIQLGQKKQILL